MQSSVSVQIFATDLNEAAIEKARRGAYIENIAADVSAERLARFFTRSGTEFQVSRKGPRSVRLLPARPADRPGILADGPGELPECADLPGFGARAGAIPIPFRP